MRGLVLAVVAVGSLLVASGAQAAPQCPISYGTQDDAKPNKVYTWFPTSSDATFPEFSTNSVPTSPAAAFDVSNLSSYTGTADALRNAVFDVVTDDYCEFNAQVRQTTTAPPSTFARRSIVAIGTDSNVTTSGGNTSYGYGVAEAVDAGDADVVDNARVWAGTYQAAAGGPGGALNGTNSTLERWANAIGGTTAHEAGHNYGLSHSSGLLVGTGEDALTRHLMAAGSNFTHEERVGYRRHFNDANFSTLASNIGLSIQTMHNWDLVNPNAATGRQFRLTFLSPQASPIVSWTYSGSRSPWVNPTLTANGTQTFKGTSYNRFRLTWSTGQNWDNGSSGQVPGGAEFHVGATLSGVDFNQPDPIIITKSELLDTSGTPLALQPRLVGYDDGTLDSSDGTLDIAFDNFGADTLEIRALDIQLLPRVLSIDSMLPGRGLRDWAGHRIAAHEGSRRVLVRKARSLRRKRGFRLPVARMAQKRHFVERIERDCSTGDATFEPDTRSCTGGVNVSLFPATTMYLRFTVVDPDARVWDRKRKRYVRKDLTSRVFYQVGGIHPDLNENGTDDFIDILNGESEDGNRDGVPDEAQRLEQ
jgi:hypothetical protein